MEDSEALIEDLRRAMSSDNSRGMGDWGPCAVQWINKHTGRIFGGTVGQRYLTVTGCQVLTEIMERHCNSPSINVREFMYQSVLPVVIDSLSASDLGQQHNAYRPLIVAVLRAVQMST